MGHPSAGIKLPVLGVRNIVASFLAPARKIPLAMVTREIDVSRLAAARRETRLAVSWVALFAKAYGLLFDHRVMDGRHAARALQEMERAMNAEVLEELRGEPATTVA